MWLLLGPVSLSTLGWGGAGLPQEPGAHATPQV